MRIEGSELWAWITEAGGEESLIGVMGDQVPLVFCQRRVAEKVEPLARAHARLLGQPLALRRYEAREETRRFDAPVSAEPAPTLGPED